MFSSTIHMPESTIHRALEYVSQKLITKGIHVHLIAGADALPCLLFKSRPTTHTISILFATRLSPGSHSTLQKAILKATKKFSLSPNWLNTQFHNTIDPSQIDYIIHRSLLQNTVLFSSEGLTLLSIDLCFALKAKLASFSTLFIAEDLEDAVVILRRLVVVYRGRPLTKGYIGRSYPGVVVSDQTLLRVNAEYEWKFGARGVVGVNDEYMGWRREGVVGWSFCWEDLGKEEMEREKGCRNYGYDKPLPESPQEAFNELLMEKQNLYDMQFI